MRSYKRQLLQTGRGADRAGFTLIEMIVSISIIILMGTLAIFGLSKTLTAQSESAAKIAIRSMLARAQAYAIAHQRSAGVRFQFAPTPATDDEDWQEGTQYLVLIERLDYDDDYTAVPDIQPVALPGSIGIFAASATDPLVTTNPNRTLDADRGHWKNGGINATGLSDATTFSIIFSRTGQLVRRDVEIRPRSNVVDTIFNQVYRVHLTTQHPDYGNLNNQNIALLYCDNSFGIFDPDSSIIGFENAGNISTFRPYCVGEASEMGFYIFAKSAMRDADPDLRYDEYVKNLTPIYINMYTGELLEEDFQ